MSPTRSDDSDAATRLEAEARARLRAGLDGLDGRTLARLTQARHAALEARDVAGARPFRVPGAWLPVGAVAAAAVLSLAVWVARPVAVGGNAPEASPVEDAEILASSDGPELYAEDAEFYEWADADSGPAAAAGGSG